MPATRRENIGTIALGTWVIIGLFLDGFAHENFPELESFWTPWHGVFYAGFTATSGWIMWMVIRRRQDAANLRDAVPPGYELAVIGSIIFAIGGVGDAIWHTLFGVEATIDALLSPTHVVLFSGLTLILTSPLRSWMRSEDRGRGWREFSVPMVSMTLSTSLVAFFFVYLWGPGVTWVYRLPFDPITESGEVAVMAGIGAALIATTIMIWPALYLLQGGRTPFGTFTVMWGFVNILIVGAFDRDPTAVFSALVSGFVADLAIHIITEPALRARAVGLIAPLTLWSVSFGLQHLSQGVSWQPELWGGAIVFSGLAGLALATLAVPSGSLPSDYETAERSSGLGVAQSHV